MLKIFYGPNSFAKNVELAKLKTDFINQNGQMSVRELSAEDLDPEVLKQELSTGGLFTSKELVIIKRGEDNLPLIDALLDVGESSAKEVVLSINALDKRTAQYKALSKLSGLRQFEQATEAGLSSWIKQIAKKLNLAIPANVAREMIERTSSDQQEIWICLNQLNLLRESEVSSDSLDLFLAPSCSTNAFNLLSLALNKKYQEAEQTLQELELFREDPYQTIGLICSQVYSLAGVHFGLQSGKDTKTIASELGLHPFAVSQQASLVRSAGLNKERLARILESVRWLDTSLKTVNKTEPWSMLDASLKRLSII